VRQFQLRRALDHITSKDAMQAKGNRLLRPMPVAIGPGELARQDGSEGLDAGSGNGWKYSQG